MTELLISTLMEFGYPVRLQGSLAEDEKYPETFFTFWNNSSDDGAHYDNSAINYVWSFDVNLYSVDPALVYSKLEEARTALKNAGFIVSGKGYTIASDEPTHTGRGITALIIEHESNDGDDPSEDVSVENINQEG